MSRKCSKFEIPKRAKNLWYPSVNEPKIKIDTNSWFNQYEILNHIEDNNDHIKIKKKVKEQDKVMRTERITVYPNEKQKKILLTWFDEYRRTYNKTVAYSKGNKEYNFRRLRSIVRPKGNAPQHTLDNAVHDVSKAYKTAFSNLRAKNIKHFDLRYKKANSNRETIIIEASSFSKTRNSFSYKSLGEIKTSKPIIGIKRDSKLTHDKIDGKFYLWTPYKKKCFSCNKNKETQSFMALDPGSRTFLTGYSNLCVKEIGTNVTEKLTDLHNKLDKGKKKKFKRRILRKIRNVVDDLHWKTAKNLCEDHDVILLGNMSTKGIISSSEGRKSNLKKITKRVMSSLSHYTFSERLKAKAEEHNVELQIVNESYTSKTCGYCGIINPSLGSSKIFHCMSCGFRTDRDVNGARNIFIKNKIFRGFKCEK